MTVIVMELPSDSPFLNHIYKGGGGAGLGLGLRSPKLIWLLDVNPLAPSKVWVLNECVAGEGLPVG